jgi:hypothetical protein
MGISIREFARQDGCDDKLVRRALASGRLAQLPDGTVDRALVGSAWRKSNRRKISSETDPPAPAELEALADQVVNVEGNAPYSLLEAERIKANYLAMLRQLQYDRESSAVVSIDEVTAAVASEYAVVRNHLLGLPARVAPRLAMIREPEQVRAFLQTEIATILEELTRDSPIKAVRRRTRKASKRSKKGTKRVSSVL